MSDTKMGTSSVEAEFLDISSKNSWTMVYQKIGRESQLYSYTYAESKKPQNKPLNRYRDVNPYDHSRIILHNCDRDYINANLVKMERANRKYILTQGPLVFTVAHFWLMVWEQDSRAILMLNKVIEKNEIKCHFYWPHGIGEQHKMTLSDVNLSIEQISEEDHNYFCTRVIRITDTETLKSREVIQFHYTTWPDFGVPSSPVAFLNFLKKVRASGALEPDVGPAVVHCSAGIGRSGTFCLVDSCLVIIEKEGLDSVNIQQILLEMRKDRMGLIQTPDQLRFSYLAIIEGAKRLSPDWKEEDEPSCSGVVYEEVEEEAPPPPPPRGESLAGAPARPLPAIPSSTSLGHINYNASTTADAAKAEAEAKAAAEDEAEVEAEAEAEADTEVEAEGEAEGDWSSSDDASTTPPVRESSSPASSAADDEDEEVTPVHVESGETADALRRRRVHELNNRITDMKKRARDAERWHAIKRFKSEEMPQTEPLED